MDKIFYFLGILYFVTSCYNFFTYDHKRDVGISSDTNASDLSESVNDLEKEKQKNFKKYYPRQSIGFLFFIWTCIGCIENFPEKKLFIFNLIVLISNAIILIFMGIALAFKAYKDMSYITYDSDESKSIKIHIPLTKIVYFLEMIIVGTIITIHYIIL